MTLDQSQRDVQTNVAGGTIIKAFPAGGYRAGAVIFNNTGYTGLPAAVDLLVRIVPKGTTAPVAIDYTTADFVVAAQSPFDLSTLGASDSDIYITGANAAAFSYIAGAKV